MYVIYLIYRFALYQTWRLAKRSHRTMSTRKIWKMAPTSDAMFLSKKKKNSDAILGHISSYSGIAKIEHYFSVDCMVL